MSPRGFVVLVGCLLAHGCAQKATPPSGAKAKTGTSAAAASGTPSSASASPSDTTAATTAPSGSGARPSSGAAGTGGTQQPASSSGGASSGDASMPAVPSPQGAAGSAAAPPALSHTLETLTVTAGQERSGVCQSWTVGNTDPIDVNKIVSRNDGAFHHSNWIWVTDDMFTGPDGTWPCADRGFDQILAGAAGGVFFAQSTQARNDTQAFPAGTAFEMPAHVRIVGDVHLMNTTTADITTSLSFDVYTLQPSEVRVPLQPMAFTNTALDIAANGETKARMQCATPQPDFDIYYVLPHFHVLGQNMAIDVAGGAMDGSVIYRSTGSFGEAWGQMFDPPIQITGADGLGITCDYQNPRSSVVHYGEGDQEMCVTLIYSSGKKAGGMALSNLSSTDQGGVHATDSLCVSVGSP